MKGEEPDYVDELIRLSIENEPGFADAWAPYAHVGRLIDERRRLGLSQREVAERMGVGQPVVARMENNPEGVAFARILAYARALGVELVMKPSKQKPKGDSAKRGRPVGSPKRVAA